MESFEAQLWTMVMNEAITGQYRSLYAMKQALQAAYPEEATAIAQAYEVVKKQLIGS